MEKDQVLLVKNTSLSDDGTGKPLADVLTTVFDDEVAFRNTDDFVIWDDANELVHAIKANSDSPRSAADSPYKLISGFYGNIQFLEGLYNMSNFKKVVDELFVNTGLITEEKKDMIMKWADDVRNHACVPKSPGPYYDTVPKIPPKPSVPEVRSDGRIHANPIDLRTLQNKIYALVDPVINSDTNFVQKGISRRYEVMVLDMSAIATTIDNAVKALGADLYRAEFSSFEKAAIYDPKDQSTVTSFKSNVIEVMPHTVGSVFGCKLHIEAYGVGVIYEFRIAKNSNPDEDKKWMRETETQIDLFINSISDDAITSISADGLKVDAVINNSEVGDVGLTEMLYNIDKLNKVTLTANGQTFTLIAGNESSIQSFKEGVLSIMPDTNNEVTNGTANVESVTGANLQYIFNVTYWNDAECDAYIERGSERIYVNKLVDAIAESEDGDVIFVQNNCSVPANTIPTVNNSKHIELNLNGKTVSFGTKAYILVQEGQLDVTGTGNLNHVATYPLALKGTEEGGYGSIMNVGSGVTINANYGVCIFKDNNDATKQYGIELNVTGAHVNVTGPGCGFCINGNYQFTEGSVPEINLNGVTVDCGEELDAVALYAAGYGKWNVNNCTMNGYNPLSLKCGVITIDGGTYTAYGPYRNPAEGNNNGTEDTGAALSITSNDGYAKGCEVTVIDGEFISTYGNGLYEGIAKKNGKDVAVKSYAVIDVQGGIFRSAEGKDAVDITRADDKNVLRGGSYTTDVYQFIKSGFKTELNAETNLYDVVPGTEEAVVDKEVREIISNIDTEGVTIEPTGTIGVYTVNTSIANAITETGFVEDVLELDGVVGLEATDGETTVTYAKIGGDLQAFKAAVDAMCPSSNDDAPATITITVVIE